MDFNTTNAQTSNEFKDIPAGQYITQLKNIYFSMSKTDKPMVSLWFNILGGEYDNQYIFYNQIIERDFQFENVQRLLKGLFKNEVISKNDTKEVIESKLNKINGHVQDNVYTYKIMYTLNKKGYPNIRVLSNNI